MSGTYFKYKSISLTPEGERDNRSVSQVVEPVAESYLYLATREQLNDPNEGMFQNQIQTGITAVLQRIVGIGERTDLTNALYDLARHLSQSTDNSGVFSLSGTVTDEVMWAHYAASHCGIAIEYDLNQLTRFCSKQHLHCFGVEYAEKPPSLDMQHLRDSPDKAVRAMLGHKSTSWSYEQEFRVLLENIHGPIPHDYRAARSITFGLKVPDEVRIKIYEATKQKVPKYFEIVKVPETYLLERKLLEALPGESPTGEKSTVNWAEHFCTLNETEKELMVEIAQREIESDPHFEELLHAEKSTNCPTKAVLRYQARHHLHLELWSKYTKRDYDL